MAEVHVLHRCSTVLRLETSHPLTDYIMLPSECSRCQHVVHVVHEEEVRQGLVLAPLRLRRCQCHSLQVGVQPVKGSSGGVGKGPAFL